MKPFMKENSPEHQFEQNTCNDRQQRLLVAFENAEGQVTHQQNTGDESGRDVTVINPEQGFSRGWRLRRLGGQLKWSDWRAHLLAHAGSFIVCNCSVAGASIV